MSFSWEVFPFFSVQSSRSLCLSLLSSFSWRSASLVLCISMGLISAEGHNASDTDHLPIEILLTWMELGIGQLRFVEFHPTKAVTEIQELRMRPCRQMISAFQPTNLIPEIPMELGMRRRESCRTFLATPAMRVAQVSLWQIPDGNSPTAGFNSFPFVCRYLNVGNSSFRKLLSLPFTDVFIATFLTWTLCQSSIVEVCFNCFRLSCIAACAVSCLRSQWHLSKNVWMVFKVCCPELCVLSVTVCFHCRVILLYGGCYVFKATMDEQQITMSTVCSE